MSERMKGTTSNAVVLSNQIIVQGDRLQIVKVSRIRLVSKTFESMFTCSARVSKRSQEMRMVKRIETKRAENRGITGKECQSAPRIAREPVESMDHANDKL